MDVWLQILKWLIGPVIGVAITVLLTEPLRERLTPLLAFLGSAGRQDLAGRWRARFYFGEPAQEYIEHIELKYRLGLIVGRIVPHPENYSALKAVADDRPLRIRGTLKDNLFFHGVWYHPLKRSHFTGTFDLLVHRGNNNMLGNWLGYSEHTHSIVSGAWAWERVDGTPT